MKWLSILVNILVVVASSFKKKSLNSVNVEEVKKEVDDAVESNDPSEVTRSVDRLRRIRRR